MQSTPCATLHPNRRLQRLCYLCSRNRSGGCHWNHAGTPLCSNRELEFWWGLRFLWKKGSLWKRGRNRRSLPLLSLFYQIKISRRSQFCLGAPAGSMVHRPEPRIQNTYTTAESDLRKCSIKIIDRQISAHGRLIELSELNTVHARHFSYMSLIKSMTPYDTHKI